MKTPVVDLNLFGGSWAAPVEDVEAALASAEKAMARLRTPNALGAVRPFKADRGEQLGVLDGVGILYVEGLLVKRQSWLSDLLSWTSYERLRRDLQAALDDPKIEAIALHVDSPGGEANGCDELAHAIFNARRKKPTAAFVSGMACSGGYWLASAAEKIVVSDAAIVGSIGVALSTTDRTVQDERRGVNRLDFVSSQSPGKRPDISSAQGRGRIQKMVDDLADVFVAAVAKHRGVSADTVIERFGNGGVEIGANAVNAGMADRLGSWESALKMLKHGPIPLNLKPPAIGSAAATAPIKRVIMPAAPIQLSAAEAARVRAQKKAQAETHARIRAICNSQEGLAHPERAAELAFSSDMSAEAAITVLRQEKIAASWKRAAHLSQNP